MIGKGNNKYSSPIINNAKSEKFRQKLKNLLPLILKIKIMKTTNLIIH